MPPYVLNRPALTYILRFILLALLYGLVSWFSLSLIPAGPSGASLIWPVSAVGLMGLLFWGLDLWPALALPLFGVLLLRGYTPPLAVGVMLGNVLEALAGAYILSQTGFHPLMSRLRDTLGLILSAFLSTLLSSAVIVASATIFYSHVFNSDLWIGLWVGHTVSLLSFGPFILRWGYRPFFSKNAREIFEGLIVFGSIAVLNFFIFWTPHGSIGGISLIYILIIPLIWASLRTGPRGISFALFLTTVIGVSGLLWGYGPFTQNAAQALFAVQTLIGTLSVIFLLFTSITEERKEAVVALQGHVGQLEDALEKLSSEDKAKSEFIAILAHELRNPLSPVLSGLEILKTQSEGPQEVHQMMGAHLNTLARLLDDLLDITRISQKKFRLEPRATTLQEIINRSLEMAGPFIASRKHTFTKDVPAQDLWIDADPVRLTQVFVNLLNNAAKYTHEGGEISLTASREGNEAKIVVRDNGQGITHERLQKIFEPFAGGGAKNTQTGLHIGLSLAKRMVELHHGTIEVKSTLGEGSEFIVRLPLPQGVQAALIEPEREVRNRFSKEAIEEHARKAGPSKVLVVDDNEAAAQMLGTLLKHNGHEVSIAHAGFSALEEASKWKPDAVLLDIGLPDIDGYEVARRLRAQFSDTVALVALTGYGQTEDKDKAKAAGFDDHLVKPVSIVDVERVLANLKKA